MSLEVRERVRAEVMLMHSRTGMAVSALAGFAGVPMRTWQDWEGRVGKATGHNNNIPKGYYLTPQETEAVLGYCRANMGMGRGYRSLCWEMVDADIACVSPCSVYNVIKRHKLAQKASDVSEPENRGFVQPKAVHEQWHVDFSYVKIAGNFYYFVSVMDGFSRRILSWRLCETMEGVNVEIILAECKERYPDAHPRVISDNGKQFLSKDFAELMTILEFEHTLTSPNHPQSNGKLERFHRTFKEEHVRVTAYTSLEDARYRMGMWLEYYNSVRLHSALGYLTPDDVFFARAEIRLAERKEKLHAAFVNRQAFWKTPIQTA